MAKFGITHAEYQALVARSAGSCELCKEALSKINIDHCHKAGAVRGLLCTHCNVALGWYEQMTVEWKKAADAYLIVNR